MIGMQQDFWMSMGCNINNIILMVEFACLESFVQRGCIDEYANNLMIVNGNRGTV